MKTFTALKDFKAAAAAAGLVAYLPSTGHEGMHESDPYNPVFALPLGDEDCSRAYGDFALCEDGTARGVLFATPAEYAAYIHRDDDATSTWFDASAPCVTVADLIAALQKLDGKAAASVFVTRDGEAIELPLTSVTFEYPGYAALNCEEA